MLQDLVLAATNDALKKAEEITNKRWDNSLKE